MGIKGKAVRGSALLAAGQGIVYGSSFVRNMILARLLTKADFGIAATFSLIITLLEFTTKLGVAQFVVRDNDGDDPEFISSAQLAMFVVAVGSSVLIAGFASPLSKLFSIPGQRWAIMLLALISLFRGLEHLDVRRFERQLRFGPSLLIEAMPQAVITLAAWPVAHWFRDYRAVLVLLLCKGLASCVCSHLVAEQPYRWRLRRDYVRRMLEFGWPLLVNGFLFFGVLQGDQFLIAASYTMTDLAPYAAAVALTTAPTFFFGRVFNSVMLPVLAKEQNNTAAFARRYRQVLGVITVFAIGCGLSMILGGEALMKVVYGSKYAGSGVLLSWLSVANAFRTLRIAPALAALAKGDSQNQMMSNSGRVIALAPAAALAFWHAPIWWIACTGLLGEAAACWISVVRLKRRDQVPLSTSLIPAGWVVLAVGTAGVLVGLGFHRLATLVALPLSILGALAGAAMMVALIPELRSEAAQLYARRREAGWRGCLDEFRDAAAPTRRATA